ncbi:MAG: hypothetical protein ACAI35_23180 [Candidatus Methylacidiphilales bacterium]|nr:hypothetical protein [Candidatus Methylacidiphilales bacterium]
MKHVTRTALFVILSALMLMPALPSAQARLGETPEQCNASYGKPVSSDTEDLKTTRFARFEKSGLEIITTYSEGKCVQIQFSKLNGGILENEERAALTEASRESAENWLAADAPANTSFLRSDSKATATYSTKSKTLTLTNEEWIKSERALRSKEKIQHLKDF